MFRTIWMWTHEWSDMPSRRVALTAETCQSALTWGSEFTASSSSSSRRLPRVGTRTRISASTSRGAGPVSPSRTDGLQEQALAQPSTRDHERRAEALGRRLEDQQPGGKAPDRSRRPDEGQPRLLLAGEDLDLEAACPADGGHELIPVGRAADRRRGHGPDLVCAETASGTKLATHDPRDLGELPRANPAVC